jgi:hypothetical protein
MSLNGTTIAALAALLHASNSLAGDDPFADEVVSYEPGSNPAPGYSDPLTALGSPERFTGEGLFPGVVSFFNPPFLTCEIVSIGTGGHLVVRFDTAVLDDPMNPFGIDLLVFGNAGFIDGSFPAGVVGGVFGADGGSVELSADCENWVAVPEVTADGLLPTLGYLDSGPYDTVPGEVPSDFTLPPDPALSLGDLMGLSHEELLVIYGGSGGGTGVDLGAVNLPSVTCVRIVNGGATHIEIDALSDVAPVRRGDPADIDGDGTVGVTDLLALLAAWGPCPPPPGPCAADLDGDGTVGVTDLLALLAAWDL